MSVLNAKQFPQVRYLNAHAQVSLAVETSGLSFAILEPTGFYSAFSEIWKMARDNRGLLFGDGQARSNPIHEEDLAQVCVDAIESRESAVIPAGGPFAHTRREALEMAFQSMGKPPKITSVPLWIPGAASSAMKWFAPRVGDLMQFLQVLSANDFIAPARGSRTLDDYYKKTLRKQ